MRLCALSARHGQWPILGHATVRNNAARPGRVRDNKDLPPTLGASLAAQMVTRRARAEGVWVWSEVLGCMVRWWVGEDRWGGAGCESLLPDPHCAQVPLSCFDARASSLSSPLYPLYPVSSVHASHPARGPVGPWFQVDHLKQNTMPSKNAHSGVPKNWPSQLPYLRQPCYSKKLTGDVVAALVLPKPGLPAGDQARTAVAPYSNVKITPISNASHPANGQYGLFAAQNLPPDAFILPYLGYVHGQAETDESSDYDLSLDREHGIGVDASQMGNEARFINDYRGVASGPNAEFRDVYIDLGNAKVEKRVGVFTLRAGKSGKYSKGVAKGQEILVSYGKGFWSERINTQE